MRRTSMMMAAVAGAAALLAGGGTLAFAAGTASTPQPSGSVIHACVKTGGAIDFLQYRPANYGHCATPGDSAWHWSNVSSAASQLVGSTPVTVTTGGSFSAKKTLVKTVALASGTYLVDVNFKATPNAVTTGQVFPQMFVYNGPQVPGSFSNDLFNVGSGALEQLTAQTTKIDSYYSGSAEVVVPASGETLDVYAFGYDSDQGSGSYALDSAVVTATRLS